MFTRGDLRVGVADLKSRRDLDLYAYGYRAAAEQLIDHVLSLGRRQDYMVFPICFLLRQYIELRVKTIIGTASDLLDEESIPPKHHDLSRLWFDARALVIRIWSDDDSSELMPVDRFIADFVSVDPTSQAFRYPEDQRGQKSLPDVPYIQISNLAEEFRDAADTLEAISTGVSVYLDYKHEAYS